MGAVLIKLDYLRALVTVANHGNLRDAANELGRTQSALSMTLSQLEDLLEGALFETDRKKDLTDLGKFVCNLGDELVREHDRVQGLIYSYAKGTVGHLRIASVPSVAALILPDILHDFISQHEDAQIDLMDSDSTNVRALVAAGHADLGIAGPTSTSLGLQEEPLFRDQLHVVCREDSHFADASGQLRWADLDNSTLISNETLSVIDTVAATRALAKSRLSVRNLLSLFAMIKSGTGLTVLPGLATRSLISPLTAIPITGAMCTREISLFSRGGRAQSPLSKAFRHYLFERLPAVVAELELTPVKLNF